MLRENISVTFDNVQVKVKPWKIIGYLYLARKAIIKCFKRVQHLDKWPDSPYSFSP